MQNRLSFFLNHNPLKPDAEKIKTVMGLRETGQTLMRKKYPHILERRFDGVMGYVLRGKTPEDMVKEGGLISKGDLSVATNGSGNNTGAICFSTLSHVPLLFERGAKGVTGLREIFLFAFYLKGDFFLPGGPWRQIISPHAIELPEIWFGRQVRGFQSNGKAILGPIVGHGDIARLPECKSLKNYLEGNLVKPEIHSYGTEDTHDEYEIIDTPASERFQKEIEEYYSRPKSGFICR